MKSRAQIAEEGLWAMAVIRLWAECPPLHGEFDSICDFEMWAHDTAESMIRSVDINEGEK
jgi:hypothetical protein